MILMRVQLKFRQLILPQWPINMPLPKKKLNMTPLCYEMTAQYSRFQRNEKANFQQQIRDVRHQASKMRDHLVCSHGFIKCNFQKGAPTARYSNRFKKNGIMDAIVASTVRTMNIKFKEAPLDLFASHPVPFSLVESLKFQYLFKIYNINLPIENSHSLSPKLK